MFDKVFYQFKEIKNELSQIKYDFSQQIQRIEHDKIDLIQELKSINKEINLIKNNFLNQITDLNSKHIQDSIDLSKEVEDIKVKIAQMKEENAEKDKKNSEVLKEKYECIQKMVDTLKNEEQQNFNDIHFQIQLQKEKDKDEKNIIKEQIQRLKEMTYNHEISMFLNNNNNINIQNLNANEDFQIPFFKEEFEKVNKIGSLIKFLSNEIQKSKSHKNKSKSVYIFYENSQNKDRISNVGINWQITQILFENGSLNSQQFFEKINNFPEFYIEIKFSHNNFKSISQQVFEIEKLVQTKLKICLLIKKFKRIEQFKEELDEKYLKCLYYWVYDLKSKINCIKFDSSINNIHGIQIDTFYDSFNSLTQVLIPSSVTSIGYRAFYNCEFLTQISIPSSVTSIGPRAFSRCSSLKQIYIPLSVTSIEECAFCGCKSFKQVSIPSSITSIEPGVFENCSSLTQVSIPSSVTSIGCDAFKACSSLTYVSIPSSVTSIESGAFEECSSLSHISIPSSVEKTGLNIFKGIKSLTISGDLKKITGNLFYNCSTLTDITILSPITSIEECAFCRCTSLKKFEIPSSVKFIGEGSFSQCSSLIQISIPSSVIKIGDFAFLKCTSLIDVIIASPDTEIGNDVFLGCSSLKKDTNLHSDKCEQFANINDYKIVEKIKNGDLRDTFKAINNKTNQVVELTAYQSYTLINENLILLKRLIAVSNKNIPGIVKIQSYSFPLTDEEKSDAKAKNISQDLTNCITIINYMKNGRLDKITKDYLKDPKTVSDKMNPTIRSKIIFGVASIMKKLHKKNAIHCDLTIDKILLDDNFEPQIELCDHSRFVTNPNDLERLYSTIFKIAPENYDEDLLYSFPVDVYSYAIFLFQMFTNKMIIDTKKRIRTDYQFYNAIVNGDRYKRQNGIPDHYWELITKCWQQNPQDRPKFDEITEILKNDKFALEEFGMKTDLKQLHEYQQRIDIE